MMVPGRVLLMLPESPYPARAGNALRDIQHFSVLASVGWQPVLALAANRPDLRGDCENRLLADVPCVRGGLRRHERRPVWATARLKIAYAVGSRQNPFAWWLDAEDLERFVRRAAIETQPAAILLRSLFVQVIPAIRRVFHGRLVVDCHDADEHLARELLATTSGIRRIGPWANWRGVRRSMRTFLPQADEVWAVSDEDARRIVDLAPRAAVRTVRTGMERLPDARSLPGDGRTVLLVANFAYGPNAAGAQWLLQHVWPDILERRPDARLVLAGAGSPRVLARTVATAPRVELHGLVDDLEPFYQAAAVVVVPVRHGSGTRLKMIDAWRHGKAVVTTAKGAEGLSADAESVIVADDPRAFAAATVRLLDDAALRGRMGARALAVFERCFSYEAIAGAVSPTWRIGSGTASRLDRLPRSA
jgi:glycosyltransferase involved in cell wall biosynthesis